MVQLLGVRDTPENPERARELLQEALYVWGLANRLIAEALHRYPEGLIIPTKVDVKIAQSDRPEPADEIKAVVEENLDSWWC